MIRIDGATGTADFTMSIEGTAVDPRMTLQGGLHSLRLDRLPEPRPDRGRV